MSRFLLHERRLSKEGYALIAGVDEAGRGPLAGPVVAGAVILSCGRFKERIDDSKKLSSIQRMRAFGEIISKCRVGVGIVDHTTIDRINIYQATIRAMAIAIDNLGLLPDYVIVDGNVRVPAKCPVKCIIGGDRKSLSIAAASIVAKVTRDGMMLEYDKEYPQYGFARHKGYPTIFHKLAIRKNGPSPIHRFTYRPVKEICQLNHT